MNLALPFVYFSYELSGIHRNQVRQEIWQPCIIGTPISVYDVLNWLANGMSKQEIIADFEELSEDMINACLAFAEDKEHNLRIAS